MSGRCSRTRSWLRAALAQIFPNATFASLEGERIGEGYGFASHITRYRWRDDGRQRSVVVKRWDTDGATGRDELLFYQNFRDVGARVPECYYGAHDDETRTAVLILEDLQDAVQGDVLEQLDLARARGVARSLAGLHGTWLAHPRLETLPWLHHAARWEQKNDWFRARQARFLERFGDRLHGLPRKLLEQLEWAPAIANERLANVSATLLHGDFHLDNVVFENETEPVLLDWARPQRGPAALDVAELLFEMIAPEQFDVVLTCYLETFNERSGAALNQATLENELGGALLRRFAASTCGIAWWQPASPRAATIIDVTIERASRAVTFWQERYPELFSFLR